jgi:hypothetical protein
VLVKFDEIDDLTLEELWNAMNINGVHWDHMVLPLVKDRLLDIGISEFDKVLDFIIKYDFRPGYNKKDMLFTWKKATKKFVKVSKGYVPEYIWKYMLKNIRGCYSRYVAYATQNLIYAVLRFQETSLQEFEAKLLERQQAKQRGEIVS